MNESTARSALPFQKGLFSNKSVVITGAGRGIGAAIATYLLADNATIVAHLGRSSSSEHWTFPASPTEQQNLHSITGDLATLEGVAELVSNVEEKLQQVDVLINNAGTMLGRVPSAEMTAEHYDRVSNLNSRSVVLLTTRLLGSLQRSQSASVINVTSISADTGGSPGGSIYSASKGFVSTYTRSLATELAPDGIRVNAISPGTIDTDFHQRYSSTEKLQKTAAATPLKRLGTADDCVAACLFLASPELSGFITGQVIGINGGVSYA